jgi:hypothetical protein
VYVPLLIGVKNNRTELDGRKRKHRSEFGVNPSMKKEEIRAPLKKKKKFGPLKKKEEIRNSLFHSTIGSSARNIHK